MRGLVYAVKDNREPPNPKQAIVHPLHPAGRPVQIDRTNAIEYVTAMLANRIDKLKRACRDTPMNFLIVECKKPPRSAKVRQAVRAAR